MDNGCDLAKKTCVPCKGGVPPLAGAELAALHRQLGAEWQVVDEHHLERTFTFPTYADGVEFTNRAARIAEEQAHHPDIHLFYGKVTVQVWTHKIDGLTESDFVLAAKIGQAYNA